MTTESRGTRFAEQKSIRVNYASICLSCRNRDCAARFAFFFSSLLPRGRGRAPRDSRRSRDGGGGLLARR